MKLMKFSLTEKQKQLVISAYVKESSSKPNTRS